jgi:transposase-like protein
VGLLLTHYASPHTEFLTVPQAPGETIHRQVKYLNNAIEADHGKLNN